MFTKYTKIGKIDGKWQISPENQNYKVKSNRNSGIVN